MNQKGPFLITFSIYRYIPIEITCKFAFFYKNGEKARVTPCLFSHFQPKNVLLIFQVNTIGINRGILKVIKNEFFGIFKDTKSNQKRIFWDI